MSASHEKNKKVLNRARVFLQVGPHGAAALCWVKSYVDSSTLQSVMQTVTQSQQGQDKKGCHGSRGEEGGRRTQRLRDSKAGKVQSNGDQRLRWWAQRINDKKKEGLQASLREGTQDEQE